MQTFRLGTGHFSIWRGHTNLHAAGVFDHYAEAQQCATRLHQLFGFTCEVKQTEAGWNIKGKCPKDAVEIQPSPDVPPLRPVMAAAAALLSDLEARHETATDWPDDSGTIRITADGWDFTFATHPPNTDWPDHGFHYTYTTGRCGEAPILGPDSLDLTQDPRELAEWIRAELREQGVIDDPTYDPDRA